MAADGLKFRIISVDDVGIDMVNLTFEATEPLFSDDKYKDHWDAIYAGLGIPKEMYDKAGHLRGY